MACEGLALISSLHYPEEVIKYASVKKILTKKNKELLGLAFKFWAKATCNISPSHTYLN